MFYTSRVLGETAPLVSLVSFVKHRDKNLTIIKIVVEPPRLDGLIYSW